MIVKASDKVAAEVLLFPYRLTRPVNWAAHFAVLSPLDVEIGFGLGEYLIRLGRQHPDRNFVGIEQDWARINKTMCNIDRARRTSDGGTGHNLRLLHVDAGVAFERFFRPRSVHRIFALFPCPWPKKKHFKHRLFSHDFLKLVNSRLVEGGEVKIVTDDRKFFEWILAEIPGTGFTFRQEMINPGFDTKFERKWREAGQHEFFSLELVKEKHMEIPVVEDCELKIYFIDHFDAVRFEFPDIVGSETSTSIVLKEFIFDPRQNKGIVHLVVAEPTITQHVWISIIATEEAVSRWCIALAVGQTVLPTEGVARAMDVFYQAAKLSATRN